MSQRRLSKMSNIKGEIANKSTVNSKGTDFVMLRGPLYFNGVRLGIILTYIYCIACLNDSNVYTAV